MAGSYTVTTVFNSESGNQPSTQLDVNFGQPATALNTLQTFGNYYIDNGAVNALAITVAAPQLVALSAGLPVQVKVANTNTGATSINVNGLGAKNVLHPDLSALVASELQANAIISIMYDGAQFQYLGSYSQIQSTSLQRPAFTRTAIKPATTSRNSTITLATDPDLQITISEVGTYLVSGALFYYETTSGTGGFFSGGISYTGTAQNSPGYQLSSHAGTLQTSIGGFFQTAQTALILGTTYQPVSTTPSQPDFVVGQMTVQVTTTGQFIVQWAQNTSTANNTNLLLGSWIQAQRIS